MPIAPDYRPAPVHAALGDAFYDVVAPARFPEHRLRFRNQEAASRIGLGGLTDAEWEAHFARFEPLPENLPRPLALRYHGHQFRSYNPQLGDGRGFLFAQLHDAVDGRLLDLGTKGSGQTPWSRGGDGRLTLKGGVREVLATAMLEACGVPTSRSLSLFETGEPLWRGDEPSPTRSSVLVRLSHSHVRFGTFQRLAYEGEVANLGRLVEHCIAYYLPEARGAGDAPFALLRAVTIRSARLAAAWMAAGFVHGVLNTDNMNVTGESFDYGPYRFLPHCDPTFTAAYFDETGLYAYGRQPAVVQWNCERLADALAPLGTRAQLAPALGAYAPAFREALPAALLARLGLCARNADDDALLVESLFAWLGTRRVGWDRFFFDWWGGAASAPRAAASPAADAYAEPAFAPLRARLEAHAPAAPARLALPYFRAAAPCTLLVDEIEALWAPIAAVDDWGGFHAKLDAIAARREATTLD
ncbi:MAG: YdiU family protein [bacterium]|nr:YdiU family protein [bacterium]